MKRIFLFITTGVMLVALCAGGALAVDAMCKEVPCFGTKKADDLKERKPSDKEKKKGNGGDDQIFAKGNPGDKNDVVDATKYDNDKDAVVGDDKARPEEAGPDTIKVNDGDFSDSVDCGPGEDTVSFDQKKTKDKVQKDSIDASCENLTPVTP